MATELQSQSRWSGGGSRGLLHYCLMARTHLGALQTFFSEIYTFVNNFIDCQHTIQNEKTLVNIIYFLKILEGLLIIILRKPFLQALVAMFYILIASVTCKSRAVNLQMDATLELQVVALKTKWESRKIKNLVSNKFK